jgi:hypothetical protein
MTIQLPRLTGIPFMDHRNSNSFWLLAPLLCVLTGCDRLTTPSAPDIEKTQKSAAVNDDELLRRLDHALDLAYSDWRLNTRDHAAWQVVHGAVPFGRAFPVEHQGQIVSGVDFLLNGGKLNGWTLQPGDQLGDRRGLRAVLEPGSKIGQGHADQWLGYLAGCQLPLDQPIQVDGSTFSLADLVAQVEWDVPRNVDREYSWTLMGLTAYRPSDYEWTASDGQRWDFTRLVEIETGHDLDRSACGGTHRLCGLTLAFNRRKQQGGEVVGAWRVAEEKIQKSIQRAREFQNSDGSFSSNYLERPGRSADLAENLGATGHVLEFIALAETDDGLRAEWIRRAVLYLCDVIERTQGVPLECGALYHAASGLVIYRQRVFGPREYSLESLQQKRG